MAAIQVGVLTEASSKLAADVTALQSHKEDNKKSAYVALSGLHKAMDRLSAETAISMNQLRYKS